MLEHGACTAGLGNVVVSEGGSEWYVAVDEWCSDLVDKTGHVLCRHPLAADHVAIQDGHVWLSLSRTELITSIVLWSTSGPLPIFVADKVSRVDLFIGSVSTFSEMQITEDCDRELSTRSKLDARIYIRLQQRNCSSRGNKPVKVFISHIDCK